MLWHTLCYMHYCCTAIVQSQYKVNWCKETWQSDSLAAPKHSFVHWMLLRHRHWQYLLGWRCYKNCTWCVLKHTWHVGMAAGTLEMCRPSESSLVVWLISSSLCWLIDLQLLGSHEHSQKHWLSLQHHGKQPHRPIPAIFHQSDCLKTDIGSCKLENASSQYAWQLLRPRGFLNPAVSDTVR